MSKNFSCTISDEGMDCEQLRYKLKKHGLPNLKYSLYCVDFPFPPFCYVALFPSVFPCYCIYICGVQLSFSSERLRSFDDCWEGDDVRLHFNLVDCTITSKYFMLRSISFHAHHSLKNINLGRNLAITSKHQTHPR